MIDRYSNPEMAEVWSEENKLRQWLRVEVAVCEAWAEQGVVPPEVLPKIRAARFDRASIDRHFAQTRHDVTAFLASVAESLGPESRYVHFGLTSSDVIDTGLSLQMLQAADILDADIAAMLEVLAARAREHKHTIMVGRTHGVHAEPTTFGLKLALWYDEMRRNRDRLAHARATVGYGKISGAVGTHANVPAAVEEHVCRSLGLKPAPVSTQILQRDRHAAFVTTLALIAASLEKFATEVRHLQRTEVREVEEPFGEGQTGSSAMPHKRNPELSERVCGLARVVRGHAVTALENVALWHERDISHSSTERIILPDACILLDYMLRLYTGVLRDLRVNVARMRQNLESTRGLLASQRVLLALIEKGLSRQEAYKIVQRHAMDAWENDRDFRVLLAEDPEVSARLSAAELAALFEYTYHLREVQVAFDRLGLG